MSAPPGRSATVTSLSGRVNALKFMQRASPSSTSNTPTKPTASSSRTPLASPSPATAAAASPSPSVPGSPFGGAVDEEQWSLSPAAIAKLRAKASRPETASVQKKGPTISQEAGFDAWLITREKQVPGDSASSRTSQRQTFGKLGKQKQEADEDQDSKKRSRGQHDDNDDDEDNAEGLEPDFESGESEQESPKRFVKPGSLSNGKNKDKRSDKQHQESPSAKKPKKNGAGKDQDKVVFARKRGGKPGISGGGR
ncbi:hypothetical protein EX895_002104 [Sporisorium graminicola]|uniref:Uncharacterized protein n=1 Tax=Sporisorium graminicola TaxID=280036 RepID=A0A4U7KW71_9BASI|nr:hypothetical protein EX895_002104 [Sporisorium graminicola]TKY88863.1 hypothetical protein EX895_002104 [Sporisorium graminicola]